MVLFWHIVLGPQKVYFDILAYSEKKKKKKKKKKKISLWWHDDEWWSKFCNPDAYSEPCQTSKIKLLAKIAKG